jgi:hypothetical protein
MIVVFVVVINSFETAGCLTGSSGHSGFCRRHESKVQNHPHHETAALSDCGSSVTGKAATAQCWSISKRASTKLASVEDVEGSRQGSGGGIGFLRRLTNIFFLRRHKALEIK